jgi:pilus assembly protein Flp/PilA
MNSSNAKNRESQARLKEMGPNMAHDLLKHFSRLHEDESGQGLVEYVLLIALVAFAATAGMRKLASSVNSSFSQVGTILSGYVT